MKKKLEAELISIAHRILKLKNRAELDVLQQETLKLYEKISVLRFVEDNFSGVKPTIGHASAEEKLEEIYGIEEMPTVHGNEQEAKEEAAREEKKAQADESKAKSQKPKEEEQPEEETRNTQPATNEPENGEGVTAGSNAEEVVSDEEKETTEESGEDVAEEPQAEQPQTTSEETEDDHAEPETEEPATDEPVGDADPEQPVEEYQASEEEKEITEEKEEAVEQPETTNNEPQTTSGFSFDFDDKKEDKPKQKEITFEDYHDYKEPEFVKKGEEQQTAEPQATSPEPQPEEPETIQEEWLPKEPEVIQQQEENARDWREWEPTKEEEKPQANSQQPQAASFQSQSQSQPATGATRSIALGLNDRVAFEKNLFGGSGEDLNRVLSQLNTFDTYEHAVEFINDMVKPDYNNWQGKEEYEERFMVLVEQKFS